MDIIHRLNALARSEHDDLSIGLEASATIIDLCLENKEQAEEIERLRDDMVATTGLLVRANEENERLHGLICNAAAFLDWMAFSASSLVAWPAPLAYQRPHLPCFGSSITAPVYPIDTRDYNANHRKRATHCCIAPLCRLRPLPYRSPPHQSSARLALAGHAVPRDAIASSSGLSQSRFWMRHLRECLARHPCQCRQLRRRVYIGAALILCQLRMP